MIVLPWQKRAYILTADRQLRAQFERHRELMVAHLADRLNLAPEMVWRALESEEPRPVPHAPGISPVTVAPKEVSR